MYVYSIVTEHNIYVKIVHSGSLELFPFFNDFEGVVVSGKEMTRKPFDHIYQLILKRFNINASCINLEGDTDPDLCFYIVI